LRGWRVLAERVYKAARMVLGDVEAFIFGSSLKDALTASSDIDILVVAEDLPRYALERGRLKALIEECAGLPPIHPVEIHLATLREAEANPIYREAMRSGIRLYKAGVEIGSGKPPEG